MPEVSIIVPIYNVEKYLHRCIDSILTQTYSDFECILVNDCSTDNSGIICDEYLKKDNRIKVIHNSQNKGSSLTRKTGFINSSGKYILFIDSDDYIEPDMVKLLYQKAINDNCDITVCNVKYVNKNNTIELIEQDFSSFDKIYIIKNIFNYKFRVFTYNKLLKRELILKIDFPIYSSSEDYVTTIQFIYYSDNIGYIHEPLYYYCYNETSLSQSKTRHIITLTEQNNNWIKLLDFLKEKYHNLDIFEPELSKRINEMKYEYQFINDNKLKKELFKIYPHSNYPKWYIKHYLKLLKKILINK